MTTSQRKPFVLHTRVVTGTGGGPEKTILNSPRFLQTHGIDSACLFMRPPGDDGFSTLEAKAAASGAEIIGVDDTGPFDRNVLRECLRICRSRNVDVWHAHDYKSNAIGLALSKLYPMKLVTTAHGWVRFTSRTPLYYWIDRFCMKRYEQVICVSSDLQERCVEAGINESRISLIDNAIVAEDYNPAPPTSAERLKFGFSDDRILLGAAGRLSEEKGFHHLINATSQLIAAGHNVGLIIAGEGHLKEELQQQINSLDLQGHVVLAGFLNDPRDLYRAIDIFVLSSLREGLPNVVLEAMASQRTVVTTRVNGIPRLVKDGENGVVVETDSADELYTGILRCLEHNSLRTELAFSGRQTVENEFSFARRMSRIVGVYRSLSGEIAVRIGAENSNARQPAATC